MKTFFEVLGRIVIATINVILLILAHPYMVESFPKVAPYSTYIIYALMVILGLWIMNPLAEYLSGHSHTHKK